MEERGCRWDVLVELDARPADGLGWAGGSGGGCRHEGAEVDVATADTRDDLSFHKHIHRESLGWWSCCTGRNFSHSSRAYGQKRERQIAHGIFWGAGVDGDHVYYTREEGRKESRAAYSVHLLT